MIDLTPSDSQTPWLQLQADATGVYRSFGDTYGPDNLYIDEYRYPNALSEPYADHFDNGRISGTTEVAAFADPAHVNIRLEGVARSVEMSSATVSLSASQYFNYTLSPGAAVVFSLQADYAGTSTEPYELAEELGNGIVILDVGDYPPGFQIFGFENQYADNVWEMHATLNATVSNAGAAARSGRMGFTGSMLTRAEAGVLAVPEPGSAGMLAGGLAVLAFAMRRRNCRVSPDLPA